jgi:hypothetical protein
LASSNNTTRFAPPARAAERAWSAEMTPISRLLKQTPSLCRRAMEQTLGANEAYLVVHNVMTRALSRLSDAEHDLGPALASALEIRGKRPECVGAAL